MIKYNLTCKNGHSFQGYFSGICSAKRQINSGLVECIECHTRSVKKTEFSYLSNDKLVFNHFEERVLKKYFQNEHSLKNEIQSVIAQAKAFTLN